jgi:creatinine amidohydrolase
MGKKLADMTWLDAKAALSSETVVVIPLGAEAKEHGPHLPLDTDFIQANAFSERVMQRADVVVAPPINYGFYPAFVEYPGSTHLSESTARDLAVDVVRSIAKHGPRKFYVVNIGISTLKPLLAAKALLALDGIELRYFDLGSDRVAAVDDKVRKQREGSHADEIETSMMLVFAPAKVNMSKAAADFGAGKGTGPFSPDPNASRSSPSGIYGDATLASLDKGKVVVDGYVAIMLADIAALRASTPPAPAKPYGRIVPRVDLKR